MQSQETPSIERLQTIATYLLREPMKEMLKEAVKEALHEENMTVTRREQTESEVDARDDFEYESTTDSTVSRRSIGIATLVLGGVLYLVRRRSSKRKERSRRGPTRVNRDVTSSGQSDGGEDTHSTSTT